MINLNWRKTGMNGLSIEELITKAHEEKVRIEVEITPDHMVQTIQSQNYVNQWGLPYKPIETRPWNQLEDMQFVPDEKDLQAQNPMGTDDYTEV
jgi:hypothetical protein